MHTSMEHFYLFLDGESFVDFGVRFLFKRFSFFLFFFSSQRKELSISFKSEGNRKERKRKPPKPVTESL